MKVDISFLSPFRSQTLYVACSGGLDSMALAYYLLSQGFQLHLLHVNYQKRGEDSDLDQRLVEAFASKFGLLCTVKQYDIPLGKGNFQALARDFRYSFFKEVAKGNPIITGHHADDLLESFYMNLTRDAGMKGLAGLRQQQETIYRPFLYHTKENIRAYAINKGIPWRDDVSNFESDFTRNKWRNHFLPLLHNAFPTLLDHVLILSNIFQRSLAFEEQKLQPFIEKINAHHRLDLIDFIDFTDNDWFILLHAWKQPRFVVERFLAWSDLENGALIIGVPPLQHIQYKDKAFLFHFERSESIPVLSVEEVVDLPLFYNKDSIYLNVDKINGPLIIRKWQDGDRISPIGMQGDQLVSKILKDARLSLSEKNTVYVVHDDSTIHWVVGHKIGRRAIAEPKNEKKIKVLVSK